MRKLKVSEVKPVRESMLVRQGGKCELCGCPVTQATAVLDHCHKSGVIRAVLHRGCNSLLGKIENNYRRYGVQDLHLARLAPAVFQYLTKHKMPQHPYLHPTFKTEDEKRERRNALARKRRAAAKEV